MFVSPRRCGSPRGPVQCIWMRFRHQGRWERKQVAGNGCLAPNNYLKPYLKPQGIRLMKHIIIKDWYIQSLEMDKSKRL